MSTILILFVLLALLLVVVGVAVKVMYPDGDALDQDNRRVAAWYERYKHVPEVQALAAERKHLWEVHRELSWKYPDGGESHG